MIDWTLILSNMLQAILLIVLPPVSVAICRWLWAKAEEIFQRVRIWNPDVAELIEAAARFAVTAAEQAGLGGVATDKKEYAMMVAEKWLASKKIFVDLDLISAAIEKAVFEEFNKGAEG